MARARKRSDTPADASRVAAPALDTLERDSAADTMPDADSAAAKLAGLQPDTEDDGEPVARRGRPPGSRNRKRTRSRSRSRAVAADGQPSTTRRGRELYAEVVAERDTLKMDAEARASVDLAAVTVQLEQSLSGTVQLAGQMIADNGAPAWRMTTEQGDTIGKLWAPILAPYMSVLGTAAPITMALIQTGMVLLPNWKEHRRLAGATEPEPPALGVTSGTGAE